MEWHASLCALEDYTQVAGVFLKICNMLQRQGGLSLEISMNSRVRQRTELSLQKREKSRARTLKAFPLDWKGI